MKKFKLLIWLIIFGFIGLLIYQNQDFFLARSNLRLNLWFLNEHNSGQLPVAIYFLIAFVAGLIIAYLFSLPQQLRSRRAIKKLNATVKSHRDEVAALKKEVDSLKGVEPETQETLEQTADISEKNTVDGGDDSTADSSAEPLKAEAQ